MAKRNVAQTAVQTAAQTDTSTAIPNARLDDPRHFEAVRSRLGWAAAYGVVGKPEWAFAEIKAAVEAAKAQGAAYINPCAMYEWLRLNPTKLPTGIAFTPAQHAEALARYKAANPRKSKPKASKPTAAPTAAPSKPNVAGVTDAPTAAPTGKVDLASIALGLKAAGFDATACALAMLAAQKAA